MAEKIKKLSTLLIASVATDVKVVVAIKYKVFISVILFIFPFLFMLEPCSILKKKLHKAKVVKKLIQLSLSRKEAGSNCSFNHLPLSSIITLNKIPKALYEV